MRTLILAAMLCLVAVPARAEVMLANRDLIERYFHGGEPIYIYFNDGMIDGCLPSPDAIQASMAAGLRRAGLQPVYERSNARWVLLIAATGAEMTAGGGNGTGTCYASIQAKFIMSRTFRDLIKPEDRIGLWVTGLEDGAVMYGGKPTMQQRINKSVNEIVDEFAYEIWATE